MTTQEKILNFVSEHFEIGDDPDFSADVNLFDFGFVDSLGATEIVYYIESEFSIKITQKDITLYPMNTVNEIAKVVDEKLRSLNVVSTN